MRWIQFGRRLHGAAPLPGRKQHDVVWVDEAGDQQERAHRLLVTGAPARVAVGEPVDDPGGEQRVATKAAVGHGRSVRLWSDPAGEAVWTQRIGIEVALHCGRVDHAVVVVGGQRFAGGGIVEIGVGDVPLAVVVGVVSGGAEPVAQGGHLTLAQPAQPRVVEALADAVGLGDSVQVGVVAGEDRRATGYAGERTGVVPGEAHAVFVEPAPAIQGSPTPGQQLGRLVGRYRAFLVGHQDDDVGPFRRLVGLVDFSHGHAPFVRRARPASSRTPWPGRGRLPTRPPAPPGLSRSSRCSSA